MRIRTGMNLFALGLGVGAFLVYRAKRAPRGSSARPFTDLAPDPNDPVQGFDEVNDLEVAPLDVDALSSEDLEVAQDLARSEDVYDDLGELVRPDDTGELYGVHTPIATDRDHPDNDRAFEDGQNWIEALETSAVENGAEPGRPLDDIVDDEEILRTPHPSSRRDTPVADLGSGGRRGL